MKGRSRWGFIKLQNHLYILETSEIETGMLTLEVHLSDHKLVFHLALEKDWANKHSFKYTARHRQGHIKPLKKYPRAQRELRLKQVTGTDGRYYDVSSAALSRAAS